MPRAKRKLAPIIPRDNVVPFPSSKAKYTVSVPHSMRGEVIEVMTLNMSNPAAYKVFGLFDGDLAIINMTMCPGDGDLCFVTNEDKQDVIRYFSEIRDSDTYQGVIVGYQRMFRN